MAEKEEEKPIRVIDRRMFTSEGDLRPDFEPETAPEPAPPPPPAAAAPYAPPPSRAPEPPERGPEPADPQEEDGAPVDPQTEFGSLVRWLASNAYAALGLIPDPASRGRRPDRVIARQMIDWLAVLEQKTRGNLSFEESDFLARVLYELRLSFVEVTRSPAR